MSVSVPLRTSIVWMLSIAFILGLYFPSYLFILTYSSLVRTDILMIFYEKGNHWPCFLDFWDKVLLCSIKWLQVCCVAQIALNSFWSPPQPPLPAPCPPAHSSADYFVYLKMANWGWGMGYGKNEIAPGPLSDLSSFHFIFKINVYCILDVVALLYSQHSEG